MSPTPCSLRVHTPYSQYPASLIGCEFSINNEIRWSEPINEGIQNGENFTQHEIIKLPNGNYMGFVPVIEDHLIPTYTNFPDRDSPFSWEDDCELYIENNSTFRWKGEKIVEWDKNNGEIIWEWDAFDYYSLNDFVPYFPINYSLYNNLNMNFQYLGYYV